MPTVPPPTGTEAGLLTQGLLPRPVGLWGMRSAVSASVPWAKEGEVSLGGSSTPSKEPASRWKGSELRGAHRGDSQRHSPLITHKD